MAISNNIKSRYFEMVKLSVYRMTSIVITTPMIIKMHAHIKLPTVIGRPFDEETERAWFSMSRK